jgi:hypothetical protein
VIILNKPTFKLSCVEKYDYNRKHYNSCWDIQVFLEETARWIRLYSSFSEYKARLAYEKIKDKYDLYIEDFLRLEGYLPMKDELYTRSPIMFELHNQIYKIEYIFPEQSCVVGLQIPGNKRYVQAEPDGSKYDYIEDDIFFYNLGTILVKDNQVFLNGELILSSKKLKKVCDSIDQPIDGLDYNNDKFLEYIRKTYPDADSYICNGYCCFNLRRN